MYARALGEFRSGRKRSHFIWYILPQIAGLGLSSNSMRYAIPSLKVAKEYLQHPILGARLREITQTILAWDPQGRNVSHLMGSQIDTEKLKSSMTLFRHVVGGHGCIFQKVLDKYFDGKTDDRTDEMLVEIMVKNK